MVISSGIKVTELPKHTPTIRSEKWEEEVPEGEMFCLQPHKIHLLPDMVPIRRQLTRETPNYPKSVSQPQHGHSNPNSCCVLGIQIPCTWLHFWEARTDISVS